MRIRVRPVFDFVAVTVTVRIERRIGVGVRIEAVGQFPLVVHGVEIGVLGVRIRRGLLGIAETVAIAVDLHEDVVEVVSREGAHGRSARIKLLHGKIHPCG